MTISFDSWCHFARCVCSNDILWHKAEGKPRQELASSLHTTFNVLQHRPMFETAAQAPGCCAFLICGAC